MEDEDVVFIIKISQKWDTLHNYQNCVLEQDALHFSSGQWEDNRDCEYFGNKKGHNMNSCVRV